MLQSIMRAWNERQYAVKQCRELLHMHQSLAARQSGVDRMELYRQLVAQRTGGDAKAVDALLGHATESYAQWPVDRPLNLRDVIHYLVVQEYLASHRQASWLEQNLKRIVDSAVPHEL
jgi:hypothetical protein